MPERCGDPRHSLGRAGEAEAEALLRRAGMEILERRFRARCGEIDIVALDGEIIVFVEVKTRSRARCGGPAAAVTRRKGSFQDSCPVLCSTTTPFVPRTHAWRTRSPGLKSRILASYIFILRQVGWEVQSRECQAGKALVRCLHLPRHLKPGQEHLTSRVAGSRLTL